MEFSGTNGVSFFSALEDGYDDDEEGILEPMDVYDVSKSDLTDSAPSYLTRVRCTFCCLCIIVVIVLSLV